MTRRGFGFDRAALAALAAPALGVAGWSWLQAHPQYNPWAPLRLDDPPGWATARKLVRLRGDPAECRATLARSGVAFRALPETGIGECRRADRVVLTGFPLRPAAPEATCAVDAGLVLWLQGGVQPAAQEFLGQRVAAIEHYGAHSCRRLYGRASGGWSETGGKSGGSR